MAYKLLDAVLDWWRRTDSHELVSLVSAGATFIDGKLQERPDDTTTLHMSREFAREGELPSSRVHVKDGVVITSSLLRRRY
jgi:hypothetical protein